MQNRFLEGVKDISAIKYFKSAALPNIQGKLPHFGNAAKDIAGAFYYGAGNATNASGRYMQDTARSGLYTIKLDLSLWNPIYKDDCNTVQPSSYTVVYIMKVH